MQAISEKRFQEIFTRYLDDKASPEEIELIFDWIRSGHADPWLDMPLQAALTDPALADHGDPGEKQLVLSQLLAQIAAETPRTRRLLSPWMMAAASVVLLLALGYWYFAQGTRRTAKAPAVAATGAFHVPPGTTGAILTLGDGSQLNLDSAGTALPKTQGNANLSRKNNELVYTGNNEPSAAAVYNTLVTPRGREYAVVLQDGTKVWLNAGSSIRYPVKFAGPRRNVIITGEAYLEVAQDKDRPFVVQCNGAYVTVLGTTFDVADYTDEQKMSVTLLQGSVRVANSSKDILLTPGHQAQVDHASGTMTAHSQDGSRVIAWTRGLLDLDNTDFASLMRQISRWYDVDVVFKGMPNNIHIGGLIHRNVDLSVVLQYLGDNGIHYTTEGKTITILP